MKVDGPYYIEHGDLWFQSSTGRAGVGRHVCDGTQRIAVAYDAEDGVVHKHGSAELVEAWASKTRTKFSGGGLPQLAEAIVVLSFPVLQVTVDELNLCIATTGRVLGLEVKLRRMLQDNPELANLPVYPAR